MDASGEKEARSTQNNMAANCDVWVEGDEPYMGWSTTCNTRQDTMEADCRNLMSHLGWRGQARFFNDFYDICIEFFQIANSMFCSLFKKKTYSSFKGCTWIIMKHDHYISCTKYFWTSSVILFIAILSVTINHPTKLANLTGLLTWQGSAWPYDVALIIQHWSQRPKPFFTTNGLKKSVMLKIDWNQHI